MRPLWSEPPRRLTAGEQAAVDAMGFGGLTYRIALGQLDLINVFVEQADGSLFIKERYHPDFGLALEHYWSSETT